MGGKTANSKIARNYVSFADRWLRTPETWLDAKRADDQTGGLWRVHDDLYDLTAFVDKHPGGRSWLTMTKGTDITEAFETHHLNMPKVNAILLKYHASKAQTPRNIKLTFHEDGFYQTLKRRVVEYLQTDSASATSAEFLTNVFIDGLLAATFLFAILSTYVPLFCFPAAVCMAWLVIAGHNYLHRRDNFRMFYFNIGFLSYEEWRVSHVLSHHLFANSLVDMEMTQLSAVMCWLPLAATKNLLNRYGSWLYGPLIYALFFPVSFVQRTVHRLLRRENPIGWADCVPFAVPLAMAAFGDTTASSLCDVLRLWLTIVCVSSFVFSLIGLNSGHHHPEVFHDGDAPRADLDWGIYQLDTMIDRSDLRGNHFGVVTHFGEHILHHMFPTFDHGRLTALYPILCATADEFGVVSRSKPWPELIVGQHLQLARIDPSTRCETEELRSGRSRSET